MLSWLRKLFKPKILSHRDKLKYLTKHHPDVYSKVCISSYITVIEKDILRYNAVLRIIVSQKDIETQIRDISRDSLMRMTIPNWCSNDGRMFRDPSTHLKEFFNNCSEFLKIVEDDKAKLHSDAKVFGKYKRYSPYEHNVRVIIDTLYDLVKKK